jgi:phosphonate transport system substrate-binding protein
MFGVKPGTYLPLVRDNKPHRGIVVVRKGGPITKIADLDGKTVAFPSPNAIGATLMTRAELERLFGVKVVPLYVKSHSSVYLHVAKGLAAAGGGVMKTLQEQDAAVRDLLSVLHTTEVMPNLPWPRTAAFPPMSGRRCGAPSLRSRLRTKAGPACEGPDDGNHRDIA